MLSVSSLEQTEQNMNWTQKSQAISSNIFFLSTYLNYPQVDFVSTLCGFCWAVVAQWSEMQPCNPKASGLRTDWGITVKMLNDMLPSFIITLLILSIIAELLPQIDLEIHFRKLCRPTYLFYFLVKLKKNLPFQVGRMWVRNVHFLGLIIRPDSFHDTSSISGKEKPAIHLIYCILSFFFFSFLHRKYTGNASCKICGLGI